MTLDDCGEGGALLLRHGRVDTPRKVDFWYDAEQRLNLINDGGTVVPFALTAQSMAFAKTQQVEHGED